VPVLRRPFRARLRVPASKSLAARAAVAAAVSEGESILRGDLAAEDIQVLLAALAQLGAGVRQDGEGARITGMPPAGPAGAVSLDARESGTAGRFLVALGATCPGPVTVDGAPSLRARPMGPLLEALNALGSHAEAAGPPGRLPVRTGGGIPPGRCTLDGSTSSQFLSALLLAGSRAAGPIEIALGSDPVSLPYAEMTLDVLRAFGLAGCRDANGVWSTAPGRGHAREFAVEPDAASAGYPFVAAAITGGEATVMGLDPGSRQPEMRLTALLERMGCTVSSDGEGGTRVAGPPGGVLQGFEADLRDAPDSAPVLAVAALFAAGPSVLRGIPHLRHKESDRLETLAEELTRLGARVEAGADSLTIIPGPLRAAEVSSRGDHRLAMSLGVAGLRIPGVRVSGPGCAAKSFPGFWGLVAGDPRGDLR